MNPIEPPPRLEGRRRPGRPALVEPAPEPLRDRRGRPLNELAAVFERWVAELERSGQVSSRLTLAAYEDDFLRWVRLLAGDSADPWKVVSLRSLTVARVAAARDAMVAAGYSPSAVRRASTMLRGLCRFVELSGVAQLSSVALTAQLRARRSTPVRARKALSGAELSAVLAAAREPLSSRRVGWPQRDALAVALLGVCGLRPWEVCRLECGDVDAAAGWVTVRGRRQADPRDRMVPLPETVRSLWATYIGARRARARRSGSLVPLDEPRSPLLVRVTGEPMSSRALTGVTVAAGENAGLSVRVTPQVLTDTAVTLTAARSPAVALAARFGFATLDPLRRTQPTVERVRSSI